MLSSVIKTVEPLKAKYVRAQSLLHIMYKNVTTEKIRDITPAICTENKHTEASEGPDLKTQFSRSLLLLKCHIPFYEAQFQYNWRACNIKKLDTHFLFALSAKET